MSPCWIKRLILFKKIIILTPNLWTVVCENKPVMFLTGFLTITQTTKGSKLSKINFCCSYSENNYFICFCFLSETPLFLSERRDRERAARMENLHQQGSGGKTAAGLNKDQKPANGSSGAQYNPHSEWPSLMRLWTLCTCTALRSARLW